MLHRRATPEPRWPHPTRVLLVGLASRVLRPILTTCYQAACERRRHGGLDVLEPRHPGMEPRRRLPRRSCRIQHTCSTPAPLPSASPRILRLACLQQQELSTLQTSSKQPVVAEAASPWGASGDVTTIAPSAAAQGGNSAPFRPSRRRGGALCLRRRLRAALGGVAPQYDGTNPTLIARSWPLDPWPWPLPLDP